MIYHFLVTSPITPQTTSAFPTPLSCISMLHTHQPSPALLLQHPTLGHQPSTGLRASPPLLSGQAIFCYNVSGAIDPSLYTPQIVVGSLGTLGGPGSRCCSSNGVAIQSAAPAFLPVPPPGSLSSV